MNIFIAYLWLIILPLSKGEIFKGVESRECKGDFFIWLFLFNQIKF